MNKFFTALAALVVVSMMVPANAEECVPTTSNPEFDSDRDAPGVWDATGEAHRQFYVDNDPCQAEGCGFSIWIYEESNGVSGLQRKDDFIGDQTCGQFDADTIIF